MRVATGERRLDLTRRPLPPGCLRRALQPRLLRLAGAGRGVPPVLRLRRLAACSARPVSAAAGAGRGVERHGRAVRREQLGVRCWVPPQPGWSPVLLPAQHPQLVPRRGWRSRRAVPRGMRRWLYVEQLHRLVRAVPGPPGPRCLAHPRHVRRPGAPFLRVILLTSF